VDLPDEFLESIYKSIAEHPILTYDDGPEGVMTVDRWRDLIKQVR
jgi:Sec7-like guanine-nucleotide exchange factor